MATQTSLLPVYHKTQDHTNPTDLVTEMDLSTWMTQEHSFQDEAFLQELFSGQRDDLLSTLLEPTQVSASPSSTSIGAPLTFDFDANLHSVQANNLPTSPSSGSDGGVSDNYSLTNGGSPFINGDSAPTSVPGSLGRDSPPHLSESPSHSPSPFISSAMPIVTDPSKLAMDPSLDFSDFGGMDLTSFVTSDATISSTMLSPHHAPPNTAQAASTDVRIDVEPHSTALSSTATRNSVSSDLSAGSPSSSTQSPSPPGSTVATAGKTDRKAATLYLTDEEKRLLAAEGVTLPTDMPLTKAEQKHLKRVQRKIKNKISAQESRKRKKDYVEGLEERVKISTERNQELIREVDCLKSENQSLLAQLKKLQAIVLQYNPTKAQAGTVVMVLILSFSLFLVPQMNYFAPGSRGGVSLRAMKGFSHHSRTLLFAETDEFGNVVDPESGRIISPAGGQSPSPPLPWVYQTPAVMFQEANNTTQSSNRERPGELSSTDKRQADTAGGVGEQ